jgi:hypothetical protein
MDEFTVWKLARDIMKMERADGFEYSDVSLVAVARISLGAPATGGRATRSPGT